MKVDKSIQQEIEKAFGTSVSLHGAKIDVVVQNGDAILTGYADNYSKKELAKKIAKEVEGVKIVVENILIVINDTDKVTDSEIASAISERYKKNFSTAQKDIITIVRDGHVWLEGRLKWKYQRNLAEECIRDVTGIKGIENNIFAADSIDAVVNEKDVFAAIYGNQSVTSDIKIEIVGHSVILQGCVKSAEQKNLITRLVRNVPGVTEVENFISVERK